jgi:hypothetical protein
MFLKIKHFLIFIILISLDATSQSPTIGLQISEPDVSEGYILFTPEANNKVYLIDKCGELINEWTFSEKPGATCYLLENGNLLRAGKDSLEIRDWNSNLVWSFSTKASGLRQHHDIQPMPNGNILLVSRRIYSIQEMIDLGMDTNNVSSNFKMERIVEIQAVGIHDANVVWEWSFADHFVQDFDTTKPNYGVIADHPELLDLNYNNNQTDDFIHLNFVDYNADLDQILITSRHLSEIYIIDHSTTSAEAAGHSGGNSNMGGDFIFRWGNPQVYQQGGPNDQKLFLPHGGQWVTKGYLDEGKIAVFNNGGDGTATYSSVHLFEPEFVGGVYTKTNNAFNPVDFDWSWSGSIMGTLVNEDRKSGMQSLPNGNVIISETYKGRISEITKNGDLLFTYVNPSGDKIYDQFDNPVSNTLYRGDKYPPDYPGFQGQDLTPKGIIENENAVSDSCISGIGFTEYELNTIEVVNPIENCRILFNKEIEIENLSIINMLGMMVYNKNNYKGNIINIDLPPGIYIIQLRTNNTFKNFKILFR